MNDEKLVCNCTGITVGDIRKAIENGAGDFESVQEATGVATVCGGCMEYAQNVVNELLAEYK